MKHLLISLILIAVLGAGMLAGCVSTTPLAGTPIPAETATPQETTGEETPIATAPSGSTTPPGVVDRVEALLAQMTLAEKVGQITQVEKNSIAPADVAAYFIGSVLSGGGGSPSRNTPQAWREMVSAYQDAALSTRLGIPILYGVDAVHGHANAAGATFFPHNIGLGAAHDPDLMRRIGEATAIEMAITGVHWNFAPVVAVPQDIRWGRTYEGYSEDTALVSHLAIPYLEGLQTTGILAAPKHYLADGGATYGTSTTTNMNKAYLIDQGDAQIDEATLRAIHLPPYAAAVQAGARSIMVSFSSWNGVKLHAHTYLLTDVLKGELGFSGFLVTDWQAIDQIPGGYASDVATAINAGIDMVMVPYDYKTFIAALTQAVEQGAVPLARIDDAVRRILTVKFELGLFETPLPAAPESEFGSAAHRALAREAVRKSLVLLQNRNGTLPLPKETPLIFVGGQHANDIGLQSGGWSIEWQGRSGNITPGTTVVDGIKAAVGPDTRVQFNRFGKFDQILDANGQLAIADVGIAVVGEQPYAEGVGDAEDLSLSAAELTLIEDLRQRSHKLIVILISGRPLIITNALAHADAWVAAWLPGSEGAGVADVLFGDFPFTGVLPYTWPRSIAQLPFDFDALPSEGSNSALFPRGFGLDAATGNQIFLPSLQD